MTDIAIRVENLSKQYRIGGPQARYKTIRESLTEAVQAPFRRLSSVVRGQSSAVVNETIWALKDVSFEVKCGEVVGIPSTGSGQALGATGLRRELSRTAGKTTLTSTGSVQGSRFSPASPSRRRATPRSTGGWARCWRPALSVTEGWAPGFTPN
jgi:ABC-type polysaccharide/polyol phosphate transport system ATPase subunit